ncbi:MAG: type II toxin-antitoxin system VapC family toxin [Candidatus Brockarchaeota archaeon]|nr:type II toxin-antitoxin system VapC family toxin [Candidatus Brockarchaeota archaeon]
MRHRYLFDASSLVYALKLKQLDFLDENYVQWLTVYEVLNGIWKEAFLLGKLDVGKAVEFASTLVAEALGLLNILEPRGCEREIMEVALKHGITAYDASYVVLAEKHGLVLVTEDKEFRRKAGRIVKIIGFEETLR